MILLYAIVDVPSLDLGGCRGLRGQPPMCVAVGGLGAVITVHETLTLSGEPSELWDYDRLVSDLMARATVAPVRFGTVVADSEGLRAVVGDRAPTLRAALQRLAGKVELAVRATCTAPAGPPGSSGGPTGDGRAYLRALPAGDRQGTVAGPSDLSRLHAALARRADAAVVTSWGERSLTSAYLLPSPAVEDFRRVAVDHASERAIRMSVTGPWAPYSFAAGEAATGG